MSARRGVGLALALCLSLLAGCQSGGEQKPGTGPFRVALLTPGPISDGG